MNKPVKIVRSDYDKIYIGSDFHYNHKRDFIWTPRGFNTYEDHDKFIWDECSKLTENDLLIFLGDFALNTTDQNAFDLFMHIKAHILYVFGNHEGYPNRFYTNSLKKFYKEFKNTNAIKSGISEDHASLNGINFNSAVPFKIFPFTINKITQDGIAGCHPLKRNKRHEIVFFGEELYFKIGGKHYFCRHMAPLIWDKMKEENFVSLCGHSHGNLNIGKPDVFDGGKILDVGVDNAIKHNGSAFFEIEEIDEIMNKKPIKTYDHH